MSLTHLHLSVITLQHLECASWYGGNYQWTRRAAVACRPVGGWGLWLQGCQFDSSDHLGTPWEAGGRRGRMKSTLVHATPRLEWPYVRFSDTGQLPLNPAVWGTRSMMFASQGGLTGCTNEENCKVDSSKTKCQSVDFRAGSFWWIRATQMKLEGTWKSIDEYWATASPFQEYRTPLLAKGGKKKTLTFGKTSKNIHVNIQMCHFHCTVGHHRPPWA